jgi:hypothetical protein
VNIAICSAFFNATEIVERYFAQINRLNEQLVKNGDTLYLVIGDSGSVDDTADRLYEEIVNSCIETTLLDVVIDEQDDKVPFRRMAQTWSEIISAVPPNVEAVGLVDSELVWEPITVTDLIDGLQHVPVVAPLIMNSENNFCDDYPFRRNGIPFRKRRPFHPDLKAVTDLLQVDSAGGMLFMDAEIARDIYMPEADGVVGLCRQVKKNGGTVWVDTGLKVRKP